MRGHNDCLLSTERQSPSVGSAVYTSTGEVGRGAKSNGALCCALQTSSGYSVWKQSYNACPTLLYSIDIGNVSVFTVQIDDTSDEADLSANEKDKNK